MILVLKNWLKSQFTANEIVKMADFEKSQVAKSLFHVKSEWQNDY